MISSIDKGNLCVFSVALLVNAIYLYKENKDSIESDIDHIISEINMYALIIASIIYAGMVLVENTMILNINKYYIRYFSLVLFSFSIYSVYRAILIQFKDLYPDVDIKEESNSDVNSIMRDM